MYRLPCSHRTSGQSGPGADDPGERIGAGSAATQAFVDLVHAQVVYRREVVRTPMRSLATEIGISRSAVEQFHKQRSRPGKNWPRLRDWYMRTRERKTDEYQTPPELMVASALETLSGLPNAKRAQALRVVAANYRELFTDLKEPLPEWVQMLTDLADRGGEA